jgi:hypothetical protein
MDYVIEKPDLLGYAGTNLSEPFGQFSGDFMSWDLD